MSEDRFFWEKEGFKKHPYRVPEGYFHALSDRIMDRVTTQPGNERVQRGRILKPWMAWVSGAAAVLIAGWIGIWSMIREPRQETTVQAQIAMVVDFFAGEFNEGHLTNYLYENQIELVGGESVDYNSLIQLEPEIDEEAVFNSMDL